MSERLLHILGEPERLGPKAIGGKGASLARMCSAGIPTPPGFCLSAHAHALYMRENDLLEDVEVLRRRLPDEAARVALQRLMRSSPLPRSLHDCLSRGIEALAARCNSVARLAVRSSASQEDGARTSFAGQHETALGVSPARLEEAVRGCWASLWSRRAVAYRCAHDVSLTGDLMAVVVQPLLAAQASAVVFSAHPVTGSRDEILVSARSGYGEPLVSGAVDAATVTLDRATLGVIASDGPLGIDSTQVARLVELCLRVERAFGMPVDVEASLAQGRWWLLQARPITTVPTEELGVPPSAPPEHGRSVAGCRSRSGS